MARNNDRDRDRSGNKKTTKEVIRKGGKKKVCIFCVKQIDSIGYRDVDVLRKYMSDRGKIRARRVSGNCSQHQRSVAVAIKTARELALLPYTQRTVAERTGGGRGSRNSSQGDNERSFSDANTRNNTLDLAADIPVDDLDVIDMEVDDVAVAEEESE